MQIINFIDRFSNTYLEVRASRDITNPIENIKSHLKNLGEEQIRSNNFDNSTKIFREDYYNLDIINRMNIVKATDNILFANKYLNTIQIDRILNYEGSSF